MIEPIGDAQQLLTLSGVMAAVYVIMQFLVKPWLRARYGVSKTGQAPAAVLRLYNAAMNTAAAVVGVLLATLAALAFPPAEGYSLGLFLTAFVVGIGGAFLAVGVHEAATNFNKRLE